VLTLGRQQIHFTYRDLQDAATAFNYSLHPSDEITLSHHPFYASLGYISDTSLFQALGFTRLTTLDYSDYEGASVLYDLNSDQVPESLIGAYDMVIDGGTIEHVFHIPNALSNIHQLLTCHGRAIHVSPSSNHMDHGFYMFSPTLFWDYYHVNGYEINKFQVFRYTARPSLDLWEMSDYFPGCLDRISFGGLDGQMYGILCIATKTLDSTHRIVPQQGTYLSEWRAQSTPMPEDGGDSPDMLDCGVPRTTQLVKGLLRSHPHLYERLRRAKAWARRWRVEHGSVSRKRGLGLKIVDRF